MKFSVKTLTVTCVAIAFALSSCSDYQKVLKSSNYDKKYDLAVKYYQKKDYFKAATLLEDILPIVRGTARAEKVFYYYAYCQYGMGEFLMAAYHFENFVKTFPSSQYTEECMYMTAFCYNLDSPNYSLDQTNTYKAINEIQLFVNKYPHSSRIQQCNDLMDKLRAKLEIKAFEIAKLYFNMEDYKSSIYTYRNLIKDFPDTKYREESLFMILKSSYLFGYNSVETKKHERLKSAVEAFNAYMDAFPSGKYQKDAQNIFDNTVKQIEKVKKTNS